MYPQLERFHNLSLQDERDANSYEDIDLTTNLSPKDESDDGFWEDVDLAMSDNRSIACNASNASMTSISTSSIKRHGRSYPGFGETWSPNDEQALAGMDALHDTLLEQDGSWFFAPVFDFGLAGETKHILDVGTGSGKWAYEVADRFPDAVVKGVDLSPVPHSGNGATLQYEVEDVTREWVWTEKFDLVHIRQLYGAFAPDQWDALYRQAYANLVPGGWIEQVEIGVEPLSFKSSLGPSSSPLREWADKIKIAASTVNRPLDTMDTMERAIKCAGFVHLQERTIVVPIGDGTLAPRHNTATVLALKESIEALSLYFLTSHELPQPWSTSEVAQYVATINHELDRSRNLVQQGRRIWAQKP